MLRKSLLLLLTIAVALSVYFPKTYSAQFSPQDRAIAFIREVLLIDVDKYNATYFGPFTEYRGDDIIETYGKITFKSETGLIEVSYAFANGSMSFCTVRIRDSSPKFTQQLPIDFHDRVDFLLEKYQVFSGDQSLQEIKNMISNVNLTESSTTYFDNFKLQVTKYSSRMSIECQTMFDGAGYGHFQFGFANGYFDGLSDDRSYVKIGGGRVNVSKDEAVQIALSNVQAPSWGSIVKDHIGVGLRTMGRNSTWVWYPYWLVILPLSGNYDIQSHGGCIAVEIWADTAQVIRTYLTTGGGGNYNATTPSPIPTTIPTQSQISSPTITSPTSTPSAQSSLTPTSSPRPSPSPTQHPTPTPAISPTPSPTFIPSPSPTQSPTLSPTLPVADNYGGGVNNFPIILGVVAFVIVAITTVGLAVYFTKFRKKKTAN